ncbi:hypothetical protein ILUMI_10836 [Ignelater luminosus]|uniref:Uncharacterized protein n=1 Tax=Ignelater luminosus TaxID=2038154 RepID=A0A8K0CZM7_IGNLU|nr:hypothetical protein ILUMI_10836 [Ignelater luminosus]
MASRKSEQESVLLLYECEMDDCVLIKLARERIRRNPCKVQKKMALEIAIPHRSLSRIITDDLTMKACKKRTVRYLNKRLKNMTLNEKTSTINQLDGMKQDDSESDSSVLSILYRLNGQIFQSRYVFAKWEKETRKQNYRLGY